MGRKAALARVREAKRSAPHSGGVLPKGPFTDPRPHGRGPHLAFLVLPMLTNSTTLNYSFFFLFFSPLNAPLRIQRSELYSQPDPGCQRAGGGSLPRLHRMPEALDQMACERTSCVGTTLLDIHFLPCPTRHPMFPAGSWLWSTFSFLLFFPWLICCFLLVQDIWNEGQPHCGWEAAVEFFLWLLCYVFSHPQGANSLLEPQPQRPGQPTNPEASCPSPTH